MTAPINNSFYADPQGLASLRNDAKAQTPEALKETARQFESLFTQMILKSMREATKSTGGDNMFESDQTEFYQGMFDDQMAVHLSQGRGLGLADMLVEQLSRSRQSVPLNKELNPATPATNMPGNVVNGIVPGATQTTSSAASAPESKEDFIRRMWPHAQKAASEIGVDPHALLAQAALETGWGKSIPSNVAGDSSFNLFGIKAGGQWSGATVNVSTLEFQSGVAVRKVERFRAYDSPEQSFKDYAGLIRNNARYGNAVGTGDNVAAFASALQEGGYATDPQYARKIVAVADQVRSLTSAASFSSPPSRPIGNQEV